MQIKYLGEMVVSPVEFPEIKGGEYPVMPVRFDMSDTTELLNVTTKSGATRSIPYTTYNPAKKQYGIFADVLDAFNSYPAKGTASNGNSRVYFDVVSYCYADAADKYFPGGSNFYLNGVTVRYPDYASANSVVNETAPAGGVLDFEGKPIRAGFYAWLRSCNATQQLPQPTSYDKETLNITNDGRFEALVESEFKQYDNWAVLPGVYSEYNTIFPNAKKVARDVMAISYKITQGVICEMIYVPPSTQITKEWCNKNPNAIPYTYQQWQGDYGPYRDYLVANGFSSNNNFDAYDVIFPDKYDLSSEPKGAAKRWQYVTASFYIQTMTNISATVTEQSATFSWMGTDGVESETHGNLTTVKGDSFFKFLSDDGAYVATSQSPVCFIGRDGTFYYKSTGASSSGDFANASAQLRTMETLGHYPLAAGMNITGILSRGMIEGIFPTTSPDAFEESMTLEDIDDLASSNVFATRVAGAYCAAVRINTQDADDDVSGIELLFILRDCGGYYRLKLDDIQNIDYFGFDGEYVLLRGYVSNSDAYEWRGFALQAKLPKFTFDVPQTAIKISVLPCYNKCLGHNSQIAKV